jgi:spore coat polysaccharide biosynthesis predicted glycosyltransferase SpsG
MLPSGIVFAANASRLVGAGHLRRMIEIAKSFPSSIQKVFYGSVDIPWLANLTNEYMRPLNGANLDTSNTIVVLDSYDERFCNQVSDTFHGSLLIQIADQNSYVLPSAKVLFMDKPFKYANGINPIQVIGHDLKFFPARNYGNPDLIFSPQARKVLVTTGGVVHLKFIQDIVQILNHKIFNEIEFNFFGIDPKLLAGFRKANSYELGSDFDSIAATCDTAISSAGTTIWDLLANNIVLGIYHVASNQKGNFDFAIQKKKAISLISPTSHEFSRVCFERLLLHRETRFKLFHLNANADEGRFLGSQLTKDLIVKTYQAFKGLRNRGN